MPDETIEPDVETETETTTTTTTGPLAEPAPDESGTEDASNE